MTVQELFAAIDRDRPLAGMKALDMFGGYGEMLTKAWAKRVGTLTTWDLRYGQNPEAGKAYLSSFPEAKLEARDSLVPHGEQWDLVVADNPIHIEPFPLLKAAVALSSGFVLWNASTDLRASIERLYGRGPHASEVEAWKKLYGKHGATPEVMLATALERCGVITRRSDCARRTDDIQLFSAWLA